MILRRWHFQGLPCGVAALTNFRVLALNVHYCLSFASIPVIFEMHKQKTQVQFGLHLCALEERRGEDGQA